MDARDLKTIYEEQLEHELEEPVHRHVDRIATRCMLRVSREMPSGEFQETKGWGTWIWSDLHLGHDNTIRHFGRPFTDTWQMDEVLFSTWERTVRPGDTIICLGDVAVGGLSGTRLARLRRAPGRKILVIGNHEINRIGCVDIEGFDEIHMTLYASGTPPLLLTHMPLYKVPEGCVNVHGHIHNERAPSWTEHINVSVEQLRYRPRPWKAIRELAKHLAAGVLVPGRTTAQRLTHMG